MYRFILGKFQDTTNLVINGDFATGDFTGWVADAEWSVVGNIATHNNNANANIEQLNVFEVGEEYIVNYDLRFLRIPSRTGVYVGDYAKETETATALWVTYTKQRVCLRGTSLTIRAVASAGGGNNIQVDNIEAYKLNWNNPINDEPIGWDEAKITVERDKDLNGLYAKYIADLTFWGDGWDYIYNEYLTKGVCSEIPVLIEYQCAEGEAWETIFEGLIYLSDCEFDLGKCQVTCDIEDRGVSNILIRNKNVKIYAFRQGGIVNVDEELLLDNEYPAIAAPVQFHDTNGAYPGAGVYQNFDCYHVGLTLQKIVLGATDLLADIESDLFFTGLFEHFIYTLPFAVAGAGGQCNIIEVRSMSFAEIFENLNKIFNISFRAIYPNNVPTFKIEPKVDFLGGADIMTLNNVPAPKFEFDKDNIVRTVNIGYTKIDAAPKWEKGVQYVVDDKCAEGEYNLVCEYIQDGDIIKDLLSSAVTCDDYSNDVVVAEVEKSGAVYRTLRFGAAPNVTYNGNIDADDNMARWVETLPASSYKRRDTSENLAKTNTPLIRVFTFDYPLTKDEFGNITDTTQRIVFNSPELNVPDTYGYIQEMEYNIQTGLTSFKLLSP